MLDIQVTSKQLSEQIVGRLFGPKELDEGGAGSGNWGHKGRPGMRGGSLPRGSGGGGDKAASEKTQKARQELSIKRNTLNKLKSEFSGKGMTKATGRGARIGLRNRIARLQREINKLTVSARAGGSRAAAATSQAARTAERQPG